MVWEEVTLATVTAHLPTDVTAQYTTWLAANPTKAGRLQELVDITIREFRDAIKSNHANIIHETETYLPQSCIRHCENIILFSLCMEMGLELTTAGSSARVAADVFLRQIPYGRWSTTTEDDDYSPSPSYTVPTRGDSSGRSLPIIAALLMFAQSVFGGWIDPNAGPLDTAVQTTFLPSEYSISAQNLYFHLFGINAALGTMATETYVDDAIAAATNGVVDATARALATAASVSANAALGALPSYLLLSGGTMTAPMTNSGSIHTPILFLNTTNTITDNGTNLLRNGAPIAGSDTFGTNLLNNLADVDVSPALNDALTWNGSIWTSSPAVAAESDPIWTNARATGFTMGPLVVNGDADINGDLDVSGGTVIHGDLTVTGTTYSYETVFQGTTINVGTNIVTNTIYTSGSVIYYVYTNFVTTNDVTTYVNNQFGITAGGYASFTNASWVSLPGLFITNGAGGATATGVWDFTSATVTGLSSSSVAALEDLTNVTAAASANDVLVYDGANWTNTQLGTATVTNEVDPIAMAQVTNKVSKTGDTMSGILEISTQTETNGLAIASSNSNVRIGRNALLFDSNVGQVAIGDGAKTRIRSVAIGEGVDCQTTQGYGVGVGQGSKGYNYGVSVGRDSQGYLYGASLGYDNDSYNYGSAVGSAALGYNYGVAFGRGARGYNTNIAIGVEAMSHAGSERIAIGHSVSNAVDNSAAIRGSLYLDGGTGIYSRATFGSGGWNQIGVVITNVWTGGTMTVKSSDGITGFWE